MTELPEDLKAEIEEFFVIRGLQGINHKPHPFVLGPKHIEFSSKKHCGIIGEAALADPAFPTCASCNLSYKEHTSDHALFLQLRNNLRRSEIEEFFTDLGKKLESLGIDGIVFVETPEKFRFIDDLKPE